MECKIGRWCKFKSKHKKVQRKKESTKKGKRIGSNYRPPQLKYGALPTELHLLLSFIVFQTKNTSDTFEQFSPSEWKSLRTKQRTQSHFFPLFSFHFLALTRFLLWNISFETRLGTIPKFSQSLASIF